MTDDRAVSAASIALMRGVVYSDADEDTWATLMRGSGPVRDHFATIGVEVVIDDVEGYAYLRQSDDDGDEDALPRLVRRRALSYPVSLTLVLLRKRLVEHETLGGAGRLVLSTEQITDMLRVFAAESTNEARLVDQAERTIRKAAELGFVRPLRGETGRWEVLRILKAYVDAQTLDDFASRLAEYADGSHE